MSKDKELEKKMGEELRAFLQKKEREPAGGSFFKVYYRGRAVQTIWGRSLKEAEEFLKKQYVQFSHVEALA